MDDIKIATFTIKDLAVSNSFHNEYYGTNRSNSQFLWQFSEAIDEKKSLFSLAKRGEEIVGTQALMPIEIMTPLGPLKTSKTEETLVKANSRGKDLFHRMYAKLFSKCEKLNINYIWGFTPADKAFRKLGFDIPTRTKQMLLVNSANCLSKILSTKGRLKSWLLTVAGFILYIRSRKLYFTHNPYLKSNEKLYIAKSASDLAINWMQDFCTIWNVSTINRKESYLNWRFFENPYIRSNILIYEEDGITRGYVAFSMNEKFEGFIVDLISYSKYSNTNDNRILRILIFTASKRLSRMGAHSIRFWNLNQNKYDKIIKREAKKLGFTFLNKGNPIVFKTLTEKKTNSTNFKNWYVTRLFTDGENG